MELLSIIGVFTLICGIFYLIISTCTLYEIKEIMTRRDLSDVERIKAIDKKLHNDVFYTHQESPK